MLKGGISRPASPAECTYYSDDSETPMEAQVERDISLGLREICFTDHVDDGIKRDWDDPRGMEYRKGGPEEPERMALANVDYVKDILEDEIGMHEEEIFFFPE